MKKTQDFSEQPFWDDDSKLFTDWQVKLHRIQELIRPILLITAVVVLATTIYLFTRPKEYASTAKLFVVQTMAEAPAAKSHEVGYEDSEQSDLTKKVYFLTQIELLQSDDILEKVVKELSLDHYFGTDTDGAIRILKGSVLKIIQIPNTQIVEVSATVKSPQMAARIANMICENYIQNNFTNNMRVPPEILKIFSRISQIEPTGDPKAEGIESYSKDVEEEISMLPTLLNDPGLVQLHQDIFSLEQQKAVYKDRYTSEHPKMKVIDDRIEALNKEFELQKERLLFSLRDSIAGKFNIQNSEIIERARPNKTPSGRNKLFFILLSGVCSFMALCFFAGISTIFDRRISREDDFDPIDNLFFLGYIPEIDALQMDIASALKDNTLLRDHVHEICNSIFMAGNSKVILFTGVLPQQGKTMASCLTALTMSNLGQRVLLVDVDLRVPGVHQKFGIENTNGLSEYLSGQKPWRGSLKKIEGWASLDILTAGALAPNAPTLLASDLMKKFLNEARNDYDRIILDLPPAMYIPDAFIVGGHCDGIILIFKPSDVPISQAKKVHAKMLAHGLRVIGGCINRINIRNLDFFHNYFRAYNKYYPNNVSKS